ncbi:flocculation protein FLO11-like isoform X2 [Zingiber officinale]|uniref:flocculation protein FLO11-like isoform X2 n=1 Tax=Zingiber officinale TaxID=94328 RepID=UPI001C4B1F0F|nr:flocculation protein FLO11-like isoform X2 [Zingiber officinale]
MKRKAVDEDDCYAGTGGKLTQREIRPRIAATPYDRPALTKRSKGYDWISARPTPAVFSAKFAAASTSASIHDPQPSTSEALPQSRQEDCDRPSSSRDAFVDPSNDQSFGEATNMCDNSGIAEVELWLKQRTFSREQSKHLKELLQSRTRDFSHQHGETNGILNQQVPIKSQSLVLSGQLLTPKSEKSLKTLVVHDGSSSPVEIAKAYMEGLVTEPYHEPPEGVLKNKAADNNALASELAYSSLVRTPVCWPGAIVENNGNHLTPKTVGLKVEPYSSRRTPYSVSIFSKSKFQDGRGSQRTRTVSSFGWKKSSASLRGITVPPKYSESTPSKELLDSNLVNFSSTPSTAPTDTKNLSSTWKASDVPPKSTQIAMKILDHLNRTIPSPKEKMVYSPEMIGTKSISKFASDWHTKTPDDGKTKASLLSKGATEKDNFPEDKATAMPTMKDHNEVLPSVTLMGKDQLLGATEKSRDAVVKVLISSSTPLKDLSETPSTPALTSSPADVAFKVPVSSSTSLNASPEPPAIPGSTALVPTIPTSIPNNIPSFSFRSPSHDSGLNFSFATTSNPTVTDTPEPQFKFGSEEQRSLTFWFRGTESELY